MSLAGTSADTGPGRTEPGCGLQTGTPPRLMTVVTAAASSRCLVSADGERGLGCRSQRRLFGLLHRGFPGQYRVGLGVLDVARCLFLAKTHARYLLGTAVPSGGSLPHLPFGITGAPGLRGPRRAARSGCQLPSG